MISRMPFASGPGADEARRRPRPKSVVVATRPCCGGRPGVSLRNGDARPRPQCRPCPEVGASAGWPLLDPYFRKFAFHAPRRIEGAKLTLSEVAELGGIHPLQH